MWRDIGEFQSNSEAETKAIAARNAAHLKGGEVILLSGELGVGKTVFVKGLAGGLGIDEHQVTSPSFTLMSSHAGRLILHHIDLYRLSSLRDIDTLGLEDYIGAPNAVTAVEWGERVQDVRWDANVIRVHLRRKTTHVRAISIS